MAVRLAGMSDSPTPPGERAPEPANSGQAHPVEAVLAALRAVPDSVLRDLEPATIYLPEPTPVGTAAAAPAGDRGPDAGAGAGRGAGR